MPEHVDELRSLVRIKSCNVFLTTLTSSTCVETRFFSLDFESAAVSSLTNLAHPQHVFKDDYLLFLSGAGKIFHELSGYEQAAYETLKPRNIQHL